MLIRIFALVLLVLGLSACAEPPYTNISNKELQTLIAQGVPAFDVRRPEEWRQTGVIAGSQRLTFVDSRGKLLPDFLPQLTQAVGKDQPVILICRTGSRTSALARIMTEQMGYTKVYNLRKGITHWIRESMPVSREQG